MKEPWVTAKQFCNTPGAPVVNKVKSSEGQDQALNEVDHIFRTEARKTKVTPVSSKITRKPIILTSSLRILIIAVSFLLVPYTSMHNS